MMPPTQIWTTRKDASGGTAHICGPLKIIAHPVTGTNLYRGADLISVGFRSVQAAKDYAAKMKGASHD